MAQRIVGLDLGSHSVKVVHLESRGRGDFEVMAYDAEPLGPSVITPLGDDAEPEPVPMSERHLGALQSLKERGQLEGDLFVTALPGDMASVLTLSFPFSDERKIEQTLPFELESEIPFDLEDVVYSWMVLGKARAPSGEEDAAPETEVLVSVARSEAVSEHLELLAEVGVDPRRVEFDALALADLYESVFRGSHEAELEQGPQVTPGGTVIESGPDAAIPGVAMVDIGHRKTSVCVLAGDRIVAAHTLLHGGSDATRALAREIGLPLEEAERGKRKEAFIEVIGATAQFPQQRKVSDILKQAYQPIVKRLRQVFQAAMSSTRVRVTKVVITGGGSRVLNLDRYLAETLNVRVDRGRDVATRLGAALPLPADAEAAANQGEVPEAADALAFALSGMLGEKSRSSIDFRTGEFAWRGELDFVRERAAAIGIWAGVLVLLLGISGGAQAWVLGSEEGELVDQQVAACQAITGMEIDSATRCLAIIQERVGGQAGFQIPPNSAADYYLEVSRRIPPEAVLARKVTELDVTDERVRMKATTSDFDAVDKIVAALSDGECFAEVEKGKARNSKGGVDFNVNIRLDCEAAPGKPLPETPTTASAQGAAAPGPAATPERPPPSERAREIMERRRKARGDTDARRKAARDQGKALSKGATKGVRDALNKRLGRNPMEGRDGEDPVSRRERKRKAIEKQGDTLRELRKAGKLDPRERGGGGRPGRARPPSRDPRGQFPARPLRGKSEVK